MEDKVIKLDLIYYKSNKILLEHFNDCIICKYEQLNIIGTKETNITNIISKTKELLEMSNNIILFLGIKSIDNKKNIYLKPFFKSGIKTFFDGIKINSFSTFLNTIGYNTKIDNKNIVTSVTLK